jgi:glycosyltransferase involved in cell wall biosynthesis
VSADQTINSTLPVSGPLLLVGGNDHNLRIPFMLRLREKGFSVAAAGTSDPAPFIDNGFAYRRYQFDRFSSPSSDLRAVDQLSRILADTAPGLIQTFSTFPSLLVPFAAQRMRQQPPIIRTINGMGWTYSSRTPMAVALRPAYRLLQRLVSRWTSAVVFQNLDDKRYFEVNGMTGHSLSRLIPGSGIDIAAFARQQETGPSPERLRQELGLAGHPVVVTVTRVIRQKGVMTLLEAAARIHRVRPEVRFLLVGPRQSEGPFAVSKAEIERHAPYVLALGKRSDVPSILAAGDVFAFPTEYREGVPRVLLEAALARLPIVTTSMPGCTDVIEDRKTGYLVPPRSPDLLAARILTMLDHPGSALSMARAAAEHVSKEFSLSKTVDRYADLYADILTGHAPHQPRTGLPS